ncbi:ThuA domain-containing protein [Candidatus Epulonipiscium viviparus]|uniref:ThuA domain-containing protein n=1 Tax=Candidatus Epulonipiscium viviparus TaxID=420336 RepID=UPI00016C04AD|nr:ThuA domain-containing protein [Candidatus Epulopiscium viviparus]
MKKALIVWGGWDGHEPELVANRFAGILRTEGFEVEISNTLESFDDLEKLKELDLIIPCVTMSELSGPRGQNVSKAVGSGVGMAGCHGGMCDAFRNSVLWQFITGANWVSHPGGGKTEYMVNISSYSNPITEGISDFPVVSEQYYLHVDPAIEVLATTRFPHPDIPFYHISNKPIDMPVVWTKMWGNGRIFYTSLGHNDSVFDKHPSSQEIMKRGMLWAAEGKAYTVENNLDTKKFESDKKMF